MIYVQEFMLKTMASSSILDNFDFDSNSEDEGIDKDIDDDAHSRLVADITSITEVKRRKLNTGTTGRAVGRTLTTGSSGVNLGDLEKKTHKKQLKIAAPQSKYEEKRLSRKKNYAELAEDVNKWEGVVNQNRKADQLQFPLRDQSVSILKADKNFEPRMKTDLEKELYSLFTEAKVMKTKEETEEEKAVREAMSLEEVTERSQETWRLRTLQNKIGKKAFLRNKTKSKKFHRILKREKMKKEIQKIEKLEKNNPELAAKKKAELENMRIDERMSQRHKQSKWAKGMQLRAKTDANALEALRENDKLHREYKTKVKQDEEEEESVKEGSEEEEEESDVLNKNSDPAPCFENESFQKTKEFWIKHNKKQAEKFKDILAENRKKRKLSKMTPDDRAEEEVKELIEKKLAETKDDNGDDSPKITEFTFAAKPSEGTVETAERLQNYDDFENMESGGGQSLVDIATHIDSSAAKKEKPKSKLPEIDANKFKEAKKQPQQLAKMGDNILNLLEEEEEEDDGMNELFDAEDYAMTEFTKEKKTLDDATTPKDLCTYLPGWGAWAGPDIKEDEKRKQRFTDKAPPKPKSKFSDKINVLYNEKADLHPNIRNRMVSQLPYPFRSVKDYEASLQGSIGRQFVPELTHRKLIEPAIVTKMGTVIKPMDKTQLMQMPEVQRAVRIKMEERANKEDEKKKAPKSKVIQVQKKRKISRKTKV